MTERLYYTDSRVLDFSASVLEISERAEGYQVILDRTAFYPSSGGQMHDTGELGGVQVTEVHEADETIIHVLDRRPSFAAGDTVAGMIDAVRRRDNMQKHTGQHILSQALIVVCNAATVSSRLGEDDCTVEVNRESLTPEQIRRAEELANVIIFENRPVMISFVPFVGLGQLPLRKIPERQEGDYRIVTIRDFDCSACGGTHCEATGSVGIIKITGREKIRGNLRLHFLTGLMALDDYRWRFDQIEEVSAMFTRHGRETAAAVTALQEDNGLLRKKVADLKRELLPLQIDGLYRQAVEVNGLKVVALDLSGEDFKEARDAALAIVNRYAAVVVAAADDKLLVAVSKELPTSAADILDGIVKRLGGRGGGSGQVAQGGGFTPADLKVLLADPARIFDR